MRVLDGHSKYRSSRLLFLAAFLNVFEQRVETYQLAEQYTFDSLALDHALLVSHWSFGEIEFRITFHSRIRHSRLQLLATCYGQNLKLLYRVLLQSLAYGTMRQQ